MASMTASIHLPKSLEFFSSCYLPLGLATTQRSSVLNPAVVQVRCSARRLENLPQHPCLVPMYVAARPEGGPMKLSGSFSRKPQPRGRF